MVGVTGLEPATSRPPAVRASQLRHTPNIGDIVTEKDGIWLGHDKIDACGKKLNTDYINNLSL